MLTHRWSGLHLAHTSWRHVVQYAVTASPAITNVTRPIIESCTSPQPPLTTMLATRHWLLPRHGMHVCVQRHHGALAIFMVPGCMDFAQAVTAVHAHARCHVVALAAWCSLTRRTIRHCMLPRHVTTRQFIHATTLRRAAHAAANGGPILDDAVWAHGVAADGEVWVLHAQLALWSWLKGSFCWCIHVILIRSSSSIGECHLQRRRRGEGG